MKNLIRLCMTKGVQRETDKFNLEISKFHQVTFGTNGKSRVFSNSDLSLLPKMEDVALKLKYFWTVLF